MKKKHKPIAGTMTWGLWGKRLDTDAMSALMQTYLDLGIETFDHADIYGGHTTEAQFGKAFVKSNIQRDQIKLISKCGIKSLHPSATYTVKHYDYSEAYIIHQCETSLTNLRTDHLDVFLLHRPSPLMTAEVIASAISKLLASGKIKEFGVSNFEAHHLELLRKYLPVMHNQISFSLTDNVAMTNGLLDYMHINGIMPSAWSPLGTVFKAEDQINIRIRAALHDLQKKYHVPYETLVLAWLYKHPSSIAPVVGTTDPTRIKNLMDAMTLDLNDEDWFVLWEAQRSAKVP